MNIEIWSDVACPFCYIGKRHLEAALERFEPRDHVTVVWRSFQLAPDMPREVEGDLRDHLAAKYGVSRDEAGAMNGRVLEMARAAGLELDLDRVRPTNTLDAHRLIKLAGHSGLEDRMVERLLRAYFADGEHLGDSVALVRLASEVGLDGGEVAAALDGDAELEAVRADIAEATTLGLSAVPAFVIDRSLLVSGAQPPAALLGALEQAWGQRHAVDSSAAGAAGTA